jgi:hypothetical protein
MTALARPGRSPREGSDRQHRFGLRHSLVGVPYISYAATKAAVV